MNASANLKNWAASKRAAAAIRVNDRQLCSLLGSGKEEVWEVLNSPSSVPPSQEQCLPSQGQGGPGTPWSCLGPCLVTPSISSSEADRVKGHF